MKFRHFLKLKALVRSLFCCKVKIFIDCVFFFVAKQSFANARFARTTKHCRFERSALAQSKKIRFEFYRYFATLSMTRFMTQRVFGMTNSGFCLKITDIFTQILKQKFTKFISYTHILKQKFKFFTQNSRHFVNSTHFINSTHFVNSKHFINSTHFINLSQNLSHTQGFFIFLPQVFAQCKLIKNFLQGGHCV